MIENLNEIPSKKEREFIYIYKVMIKEGIIKKTHTSTSMEAIYEEIESIISGNIESSIIKTLYSSTLLNSNLKPELLIDQVKLRNEKIIYGCKLNILDENYFSWLNPKNSLHTLICWYFIRSSEESTIKKFTPSIQSKYDPPLYFSTKKYKKTYDLIINSLYLDNTLHRFNSIIYFMDFWNPKQSDNMHAKFDLLESLKNQIREYEYKTSKITDWILNVNDRDIDWVWNNIKNNLHADNLEPITPKDKMDCIITSIHFSLYDKDWETLVYLKKLKKNYEMKKIRFMKKNKTNSRKRNDDGSLQDLRDLAESLQQEIAFIKNSRITSKNPEPTPEVLKEENISTDKNNSNQ